MQRRTRPGVAIGVVALLAACGTTESSEPAGRGTVTASAERGAELFQNACVVCHGELARGAAAGPPLVHEVYEPGHHSDEAFQRAVALGVQPHHWDFGAMPPVAGLTREDVADIVAYVRELQREAGIG